MPVAGSASRDVLCVDADDRRRLTEGGIERRLQTPLQVAPILTRERLAERDAAVVENRHVGRVELRDAGRYERLDAGNGIARERRAGKQAKAHARAGGTRRFAGKLRRLSRGDDHARVVHAGDPA